MDEEGSNISPMKKNARGKVRIILTIIIVLFWTVLMYYSMLYYTTITIILILVRWFWSKMDDCKFVQKQNGTASNW